ncbi:MAG: ydfG [Gemmataceae bacterium]|nr:ydfG [Gemmataceae bacterium]
MSSRPVALVTGASAGIGKELARVLARDHDLILTARRVDELTALAAELKKANGAACHVIPADLADPAGPRTLFDAVSAAGLSVDVLVSNAGFGDLGPFAGADLAKLLRMIQVNVTALTELTGLFLPGMQARGRGRILNVGSVAGFQPGPMMAVYYASKAYVNSFSQALANELQGSGITVTCLAPGPTDSEFAAVAGVQATKAFSVGHRMSARAVAEAGVQGMRRGKVLVIPGRRNQLLIFLQRFAPRAVVTRVVRWMLAKRL